MQWLNGSLLNESPLQFYGSASSRVLLRPNSRKINSQRRYYCTVGRIVVANYPVQLFARASFLQSGRYLFDAFVSDSPKKMRKILLPGCN